MNKWIDQFLEKESDKCTDNTDKFNSNPNMSMLSVPTQGHLDQNLENMLLSSTDSTDRFNPNPNMSVLSVPLPGYLDQNLENIPPPSTDSTDRFKANPNMSVLSDSSHGLFKSSDILEEYEERLAIAEYDGKQTSSQAERIAYVDAFVSVLITLPYDETERNWLSHRITVTKNWLLDQGMVQPG